MKGQNKKLRKENKSLKKVISDENSWEETLQDACNTKNEEQLVIDLLGLMNQGSSVQMEALKNLIGKMKSGNNHRYSDILRDISGVHVKRLGTTNYSLLQNLFGLCGKTTAKEYSSKIHLKLGLNDEVLLDAIETYKNCPVIEYSDEARALRFVS